MVIELEALVLVASKALVVALVVLVAALAVA